MTSKALTPRLSSARFKNKREYMFVLDHFMIYITSREGLDLEVRSNAPFDVVMLAHDWLQEVALDVSEQNKAPLKLVHRLIHEAL